jgi:hypothetical protein
MCSISRNSNNSSRSSKHVTQLILKLEVVKYSDDELLMMEVPSFG